MISILCFEAALGTLLLKFVECELHILLALLAALNVLLGVVMILLIAMGLGQLHATGSQISACIMKCRI